MHHLHPFFKKFLWETRPLLWEYQNFFGFIYDPIHLRWNFSRITYIGDLKAKITHKFGTKINTNSAKSKLRIHHLLRFFKNNSREDPTPPPPYCERIKNSPFGLYLILYSLDENPPASRISELWKQELHTIFGQNNTKSAKKKWLSMHHLHQFFKNFPRGGPRPPPAGGGIPLPHPRHTTLWIRHWTETWARNFGV